MKLPVYLYGQPVLRKMGTDITPDYPELKKLIADMFETMYDANGIGLAAPQIGRAIRLFVIDADPLKDEYPECAGFKRAFINAHIIEKSEDHRVVESEGCLSIPSINEEVERPYRIKMRYVDENFEPHEEVFEGFAARVVQHEYDHIDGVLFIDHLSGMRKEMIKKKLQRILSGKAKTSYRSLSVSK